MKLRLFLIVFGILVIGSISSAQTAQSVFKILPNDGASGDWFGEIIALDGSIAVISAFFDDDNGTDSGSVYVFDVTTRQELYKLTPQDGSQDDWFGRSIAVDGNYAVIGAPLDDDNGTNSGSTYVFDITTGQQVHKLTPNDPIAEHRFGESVALDGNYIIIGAIQDNDKASRSGAVYVFDLTTGQQVRKLTASDGGEWYLFGQSVALDGSYALIRSRWKTSSGIWRGAVYHFNIASGQQIQRIVNADTLFGFSLELAGNLALIGCSGDTNQNGSSSGAAYVFDLNTGQQLRKLIANDGGDFHQFGRSVALNGNLALIGAFGDDYNGFNTGSAYLFDINTGQQLDKLTASDGTTGDNFSFSKVALTDTYAVIGAKDDDDNGQGSGAAYIFELANNNSDCTTVQSVEVCADDLTQSGDSWTGTTNITMGNQYSLTGTITANTTTNEISGTGTITFTPTTNTPVDVYSGSFIFDSTQTSLGILQPPSDGLLINQISNLDLDFLTLNEVSLLLDVVNSTLEIQGGNVVLLQPEYKTIPLSFYRILSDGLIVGELTNTALRFGTEVDNHYIDVSITGSNFDSQGAIVSGHVTIGHLASNSASFTGLRFTTDNLTQEPNTSVNLSELGTVDFTLSLLDFDYGLFEVDNNNLRIAVNNTDFRFADSLFAEVATSSFGFIYRSSFDDIYLYTDKVILSTGRIRFPSINFNGYQINNLSLEIVPRPDLGGHAFTGSGTIPLPPSRQGIYLALTLYEDINGDFALDGARIGLDGINYPLYPAPPIFLTQVDGGFEYDPTAMDYFIGVGAEAVLGAPEGIPVIGSLVSGRADYRAGLEGWAELQGQMSLVGGRIPLSNSRISINKPNESLYGYYADGTVNLLDVLIGRQRMYVGFADPFLQGSIRGTAQVPYSELPRFVRIMLNQEDNVTMGDVEGFVGSVGERYGVGANLNASNIPEFNVFYDFGAGNLDLNLGWVDVFATQPSGQSFSPHIISAQRQIALPTQLYTHNFDSPRTSAQQSNSLITLAATTQEVIFYLTTSDSNLNLHLIDPNNNLITPSNVSQYTNITFGNNGGQAYWVGNPTPGDWYMVVDGLQGGETYNVEAVVRDGLPEFNLQSIVDNTGTYTINWSGSDNENTATVSLYADADAEGYDGQLITANQPVSGSYSWAGQGLADGSYYVYLKIDDGVNVPYYSAYSSAVSISDTTAPSAPTGLIALADESQVVLRWAENPEADVRKYIVTVQYDDLGDLINTIETSNTDTVLTRSNQGQPIIVSVQAVDASGNTSTMSMPLTIETTQLDDLTPPDMPTNLVAVVNTSHVDLSWTDIATNETHYVLERRTTGQWSELTILATDTSSYTDTTVECGIRYEYQVKAVRNDNYTESEYADAVTVTNIDCPLGDIVALSFDVVQDHAPDGLVDVSFSLSNIGNANIAPFNVTLVYSKDSIFGNEDDINLRTISFNSLAVNEVLDQTVSLTLPRDILFAQALVDDPIGGTTSANILHLGLVVDNDNWVAESNETNNSNNGLAIDYDDFTYFPWDTNSDGVVTPVDVIYVVNRINQEVTLGDVNGDGLLDNEDIMVIMDYLGYERNTSIVD